MFLEPTFINYFKFMSSSFSYNFTIFFREINLCPLMSFTRYRACLLSPTFLNNPLVLRILQGSWRFRNFSSRTLTPQATPHFRRELDACLGTRANIPDLWYIMLLDIVSSTVSCSNFPQIKRNCAVDITRGREEGWKDERDTSPHGDDHMQIVPNRFHVGGEKVSPIDRQTGLLHGTAHRVIYLLHLVHLVDVRHVSVVQNAV